MDTEAVTGYISRLEWMVRNANGYMPQGRGGKAARERLENLDLVVRLLKKELGLPH